MIFVEFIEDEKYGKVAHFINENDISVFSRIVEVDGITIYEELSEEEQKRILKNVLKENLDYNED